VVIGLFAGFALLDGALALTAAVAGHARGSRWWSLMLEGVVGLGAGALTLAWPEVTGLLLLYFIGFWAVLTGVLEVAAAVRLRREVEGEWALGLAGVLSITFGLAILLVPAAGALAVAWLIAAYAVTFGVLMLALALRLRGRHAAAARVGPVV
jgi:uncharacterized membrane protein HdeD (DUF308 family)